ncbi:DUF1345 domain-containing protein [Mucilaginibacter sp.]|jgi:uncharacterized membrane protein|uniref:DUF1345 domain-containing protein n=1 Tax=Mucilaginibacter sp. TaxID=1882438 RepID=UPI002BF028B5|nr:DUF1345 domain-containing protein [Mucilaginibacter sp.]HTI58608.1 DUF1345 domain-containing protein [Mucilaginibacter sp.]
MPKTIKSNRALIFRLDAKYRLLIALLFGVVAYFAFGHVASPPAQVLTIWIVVALTIIILDWLIILWAHPMEIHKIAKLEDSSRTLIFLFVILASIVSLGAILWLLMTTKKHSTADVSEHILLTLASVSVSWWLVHTVFAMRYARLYYTPDADDGKPGGLQFPEEPEPDYLDFVYFSFVIGMTFQVSDVEISSRPIRRLAWLHGIIAFVFNTAIVALSINIISGLISG